MDAGILERFGCGHRFRQRIVGLSVGEQHQHPVGRVGGGAEQAGPLGQHRAQAGAALAREIGIQRVEVHPDRTTIHRERRQDIAPPGKGDESEPVALQILNQPARFAVRPAAAGSAPRPPPASIG